MGGMFEQPYFTFIKLSESAKESLGKYPPALSALQSIDSFFILTAADRHSHAFVSLTLAAESAFKSSKGIGPENTNVGFADALAHLNTLVDPSRELKMPFYGGTSTYRNSIVHFGFSPKDNKLSIQKSFTVLLPLLDVWLDSSHGFSLYDTFAHGLKDHVLRTQKNLLRGKTGAELKVESLVFGLRHWINFHLRENYLTDAESKAITDAEESLTFLDYRQERLQRLSDRFDCGTNINCPICEGIETLFIWFCESELLESDQPRLLPVGGCCVECDANFTSDRALLLTDLVSDQLDTRLLESIRKDYGCY